MQNSQRDALSPHLMVSALEFGAARPDFFSKFSSILFPRPAGFLRKRDALTLCQLFDQLLEHGENAKKAESNTRAVRC